jgi:hypothetical protein
VCCLYNPLIILHIHIQRLLSSSHLLFKQISKCVLCVFLSFLDRLVNTCLMCLSAFLPFFPPHPTLFPREPPISTLPAILCNCLPPTHSWPLRSYKRTVQPQFFQCALTIYFWFFFSHSSSYPHVSEIPPRRYLYDPHVCLPSSPYASQWRRVLAALGTVPERSLRGISLADAGTNCLTFVPGLFFSDSPPIS